MSYNTLPGRGSHQSHDKWKGYDLGEELAAMAASALTTTRNSSPTIRVLTGGHNSVEEWASRLDAGIQRLATAALAESQNPDPEADRDCEEIVRTMPQTDHHAG